LASHGDDIFEQAAQPTDLPVRPPSKYQLVINMKTAKRSAWP
jgi:hypothetical protein